MDRREYPRGEFSRGGEGEYSRFRERGKFDGMGFAGGRRCWWWKRHDRCYLRGHSTGGAFASHSSNRFFHSKHSGRWRECRWSSDPSGLRRKTGGEMRVGNACHNRRVVATTRNGGHRLLSGLRVSRSRTDASSEELIGEG